MSSIYSPLSNLSTSIRVLEVLPGCASDPVECRLYEVGLSHVAVNPPKYEALLYHWGAPSPRHAITVNTQSFEVGPSLIAALRCLRKEDEARTLWVDAICINQEDIEELATQVDAMEIVYQLAERTLVWLGEEDESAIITIKILEALCGGPSSLEDAMPYSGSHSYMDPPLSK